MPLPWKVALIDDHPVARFGLSMTLQGDARFAVAGEAATPAEAVALVERERPNLAILDLLLGGNDDLELLKQIHALDREMRILVFSAQPELVYAPRALRAGAAGYLTKAEGLDRLIVALETMQRGHIYASGAVQRAFFQQHAAAVPRRGSATLSDRELQVLRLLGAGLGTARIAGELSLSLKTIGAYRERLKDKLGEPDARSLERRAEAFVRTGRL